MKNKVEFEGMAQLILSCNLMGGESYALVNNVDEYYFRLETLLEDIKQGKGESCNYLFFAFVSLASATLEYSLNFILAVHCFIKYHFHMYEKHLQPFLDLKFATKIEITPEIVSEGEYTIKKDVPALQCLKELVNKRNSLMHNSKAVKIQKFDFPNTGAFESEKGVFIPKDALNDDYTLEFPLAIEENSITTLSSKWCTRMGNAILTYRDSVVVPFLTQSRLSENNLLKKNK